MGTANSDLSLLMNDKLVLKISQALPSLWTNSVMGSEKELWFIKEVVQKNSKASYIKIIADTNGLYLFVKTKMIQVSSRCVGKITHLIVYFQWCS